MWNCKHCNKSFLFLSLSEKANHSRWCDSNPKKQYHSEKISIKAKESANLKFGKFIDFEVNCSICGKLFLLNCRENLFDKDQPRYCSRICSNAIGGRAKAKKYHDDSKAHYRTVAFRHRDMHCYACGHNRILEVHHLDENHKNNDPKNLIPLCPTHHKMIHSRWKCEVVSLLEKKEYYGK